MPKLKLILFFSIILVSCKSKIKVDELCNAKLIEVGEYATYSQVLPLIENNDTTNMELDTMYFKVDKKTKNRFKLSDQLEYESYRENVDFEVEKYVFIKSSDEHHESAQNGTLVLHSIPKRTDWVKCVCTKDMNATLLTKIKKQLDSKGYPIKDQEISQFDGEFKKVFIQYQKENKLAYGHLDTKTLKTLGINVIEK